MSEAQTSCPECSGHLQRERDETVCSECGLVVGTDGEASGKRTGAPLTRSRHDRGLSTEIGYGRGETTRLTRRKRRSVARMRRQHNRARTGSKRERNKVFAFTEVRRVVGALSLPAHVREQA